jgi:hypothetical protein
VTIDKKVYFADEVNYFLFGLAHYMASKDGIGGADYMSHEMMVQRVIIYKVVAWPTESGKDTYWPRAMWASAGWKSAKAGTGAPLQGIPEWSRLRNATFNATTYTGDLNARIGYKYSGAFNNIFAKSNP